MGRRPVVTDMRGRDAEARSTLATMHDVALLDLDGVVYVGEHAVPGAAEALTDARAAGMRLAFVTNNAGRPPEEVAAHLTALGIPAAPEEVVTSAQAGADLLAQALPPMTPVLAVGGSGVSLALSRAGPTPVRADDAAAGDVRAVLQGVGRCAGRAARRHVDPHQSRHDTPGPRWSRAGQRKPCSRGGGGSGSRA